MHLDSVFFFSLRPVAVFKEGFCWDKGSDRNPYMGKYGDKKVIYLICELFLSHKAPSYKLHIVSLFQTRQFHTFVFIQRAYNIHGKFLTTKCRKFSSSKVAIVTKERIRVLVLKIGTKVNLLGGRGWKFGRAALVLFEFVNPARKVKYYLMLRIPLGSNWFSCRAIQSWQTANKCCFQKYLNKITVH